MNKRITLKDIAKEFNVSIATVSKALKDSHEISLTLKEKIQIYAKAHHYRPNHIALSLLKRKTKSIGVIIPNIMNNFFAKVFVGIEEVTTKYGYNLISCISNESYEKEVRTMEMLRATTLDGIILSIAGETQAKQKFDHFRDTINEGIPLVMFDRVTEEVVCDKVVVNDFDGAYEATEFLIQTGRKRIAVISLIDNLSVGKLRVEGYKKALVNRGVVIDEKLIILIGEKEDFDTCMKLVLADKSIDGLLCLEEKSAVDSLVIVKKMGYKIPEEMSMIAFTNGDLLKYVSPSVTTISQHGKHIGRSACEILIDRLENTDSNKAFTTKMIKTSLIERETTLKIEEGIIHL